MEIDKGRLARRSIRFPGFDYSRPGNYFVTVCADRRRCLFGRIEKNEMVLSGLGEAVRKCWIEIPHHFPNIEIETYVVMPNHLHGILALNPKLPDAFRRPRSIPLTAESFGKPVSGSIPTIIRSFKAAVSKLVRESGFLMSGVVWQRGYFERVLRDSREFINVTDYIIKNPLRWALDEENPARDPSA